MRRSGATWALLALCAVMTTAVTVPLAGVALALLAGLLAWREWAREAALGVFG